MLHPDSLILHSCKFHVSEAGRQRVLREKKKNVHATISGELLVEPLAIARAVRKRRYGIRVHYNPYTGPFFTDDGGKPLSGAQFVHFMPNGSGFAVGPSYR